MSNIAEQKALEAYPFEPIECCGGIADSNLEYRGLYQEGYDQAMQDFDERYKIAYVVTRSDLHYDDVEKVFFDKNKAEEYCKSFNKDKNSDHRNITEIEITL